MEPSSDSPHVVRFDVFEVDLRSGELRKPGSKIRLQDKPLQILALLLEHPGEVVTREELQRGLWPSGVIVDFEHSINTAVKRLREALGDDAEHPRYIETLSRHGYRFIAPVETLTPGPSPGGRGWTRETGTGEGPRRKHWVVALVVATIVVALGALVGLNVAGLRGRVLRAVGAVGESPLQIHSIAVLPLENLSGDPEEEYFADGMTEELITDLGKISALRVISRTSVMRYKGTKKPLPEIARELNVDAIVEGTVQRSSDRVRITANLLYAPSDRHLWAQTYERDLRDVLSLQDEVARAIAGQIRAKVTPREHARLASARPVNPEAYRLYLEGRYYFFKRTLPAFEKSIQLLERALEENPNSALAYAGLSESYAILPFYGGGLPKDAFPKAKAAARKALELDSSLAEAHAALGFCLLWYDWDWSAAERELRQAIELKPSYVVGHHWYAEYLSAMGRHEQAIAEIRRAQELDPVSPLLHAIGGEIYNFARRHDEAIEQCREGLELDSSFGLAHRNLGLGYFGKGMYEEAIAEFEGADRLIGRGNRLCLARVYAMAGRRDAAVKMLNRFSEQCTRGEISPIGLSSLYVALGKKQRALDWLQKAYEQRDPYMVFIRVDWAFDPLRSAPRFQALLRRMNFPR